MKSILIAFLSLPLVLCAQDPFGKSAVSLSPRLVNNEVIINKNVKGTLLVPNDKNLSTLLIFVPDQGVVDRNGNDMRSRHFAYKQLADSLLKRGIASYRYDKRIFTQIKNRQVDNNTLFEDFVKDLTAAISVFSEDSRFSNIILLGHGQGSLTAMLACDTNISKFISIAGSGDSIDDVIVEQIALQQPGLDKVARATFDQVKSQDAIVQDIERDLYAIINPQVQPFMKSWMKYKPTDVARQIHIPTLVVHGMSDRQIDVKQAELLKQAFPEASLVLIENMNHILKEVATDEVLASKSYIDPNFKIHPQLITDLVRFIESD